MKIFLFCIAIILFVGIKSNEKTEIIAIHKIKKDSLPDVCNEFNQLNSKIRDCLISKTEALSKIKELIPKIKEYYYKNGGANYSSADYCFPVQGYNSKFIGGKNGNGYIQQGFNYFDGNKHGGHAAHDIFIFDKNQDCLDDRTTKPVNILSVSGGIVIACDSTWETYSFLHGGNYIWIYEPNTSSIFYYAHNKNIFVKPCSIVKPGDTIAIMGRTGLNAFPKRSPTHLHFMQMHLDSSYYPRPINCYSWLVKAKLL